MEEANDYIGRGHPGFLKACEQMHLLGSLRQMGSWEELRAKTMKRCADVWEIVCYLTTGETFEYQYILKDYDGVPVWRRSETTAANARARDRRR